VRLGIWDSEPETLALAVGLSLALQGSQSDCKESSISDGDADRTAGTVLVGCACAQPYAPAWSQRLKELGF
jgi:hypothetical protein